MFGNANDVLHRNAGTQWPLIQILLGDEVYAARYRQHLQNALEGSFAAETFAQRARALHNMIAPFVVGPQGERPSHTTVSAADAFTQSLDGPGGLLEVAERRRALIRAALAGAR